MKRHRFIGDGLISSGLGIALPVGASVLCRPGGIVCELFRYVFGFFLGPYNYVATHVNVEIASAIGAVHEASFKSSGLEVGDYFLIGIGILEYLVYWFAAGAIICGAWRAVRNQVRALWAHRFQRVDLAGRGH